MTRFASGKGIATDSSTLAWRIPMDRGAWGATVHGVTTSRTHTKRHQWNSILSFLLLYLLRLCCLFHFHGVKCFDFAFVDLI